VTTPQSVQTAQEVLAATGIGLITLGAGIVAAPVIAGIADTAYTTATAYASYTGYVLTGGTVAATAVAENPELQDDIANTVNEIAPAVDNEVSQARDAIDNYFSENGGTAATDAANSEPTVGISSNGEPIDGYTDTQPQCFVKGTKVLIAVKSPSVASAARSSAASLGLTHALLQSPRFVIGGTLVFAGPLGFILLNRALAAERKKKLAEMSLPCDPQPHSASPSGKLWRRDSKRSVFDLVRPGLRGLLRTRRGSQGSC
jgi:hypothetical protein